MSSKKNIYLIRHGETDYNRKGVVQGCGIDSDLNELGKKQAQAFFESYHSLPIHKIYTSKLKRTHQSVQKFIEKGIPWEQYEGLNEISWGNKEGQIINSEGNRYYKNLIYEWRNGNTHIQCADGESPEDVIARQKPVLDIIFSRRDEENILMAMHGRAIRILLTLLTNCPLHEMDKFRHQNLCLYHLVFDYDKNSIEIMDECNIEHLKNLKDSI